MIFPGGRSRFLNGVDLIAAEDTRHSQKLLQSIQVGTPVVSHHDFSADSAINRILDKLESGSSVALISDAGTPLISDPGYKLVSLARQKKLSCYSRSWRKCIGVSAKCFWTRH